MTAAIDLTQGIVEIWDDNGLNDLFKAYWTAAKANEFAVLHDEEASAAQPFPYCVFKQDAGHTVSRMTKGGKGSEGRFENRQIPFEFHVHARSMKIDGIVKAAKVIATELANEVISIFGGHPTDVPKTPRLTNGSVLQSQYQNDFGTRDGTDEWVWVVRYVFLVDVPVAA